MRLLGRLAAQALRSESRWEVQAVFRRSFYCRSHGGAWVCLGLRSLGAGPLNILCDPTGSVAWEECLPAVGTSATREGSLFRVGERLSFSLAGAEVWRPTAPASPRHSETLIQGLTALAREVRTRPARGGLQALIPLFAARTTHGANRASSADLLIRLALEGVVPLADWLETSLMRSAAPIPVPTSAIERLIGLGPGLTPSGDDFLAGVLLALHHLGAPRLAGRLAVDVVALAERRTNAIAGAHLAAAAEGEGAAALHALLTILCSPGVPGMKECVSAVDTIGHCSGWDALAGISFAAAGLVQVGSVHCEAAAPA